MAARRIFILVWMLLIVIVPASLVGARQSENPIEGEDNCAVPFVKLDGQRFKMDGALASGGTGITNYVKPDDPRLLQGLPQLGTDPVAIILIDFFTDPSSTSLGIPHGQLVESQTKDILGADGAGSIPIGEVDIPSNTTTTTYLSNQLDTVIQQYETAKPPITQFVINMSFAIVPCNLLPSLAQYTSNTEIQNFSDQLRGQIIDDPLIESLRNTFCPRGDNVVYVAASGNFGLNYPFYPALWPEVDSVGALDVDSNGQPTGRASYSNGALDWEIGEYLNNRAGIPLQGTSFAAPTHSVRLALQMSEGALPANTCGKNVEIPSAYLFVNGAPNPQILEGYDMNSDGTVWILHLRNDVQTQDGSPLVDAVVKTLTDAFAIDGLTFKASSVDALTVEIDLPDSSQAATLQKLLEQVGVTLAS